ncbi:Retrovirus-related Pol polyprotein from transposon TNT 1-94 [Trichinella pseudospiralis]|uniref:Retrovirus-related Pol polyprotein from transposon TNT 1-94 n=1 Tax=Trichinella pseudospiralis TaxID=6337 RepID=A0A0V0XE35_TRIPS|nr:Retrovirus-related Pol polyprotein from transposon TNT 1-94 [Trichinella pseudospiralis]
MRKGIRHERTIPETPQQNGVAERMNACGKGQNDADRCQLEPRFVGRGCGHSQLPKKQMPHKGSAKGQRKKWDLKSEERIFVGYCKTSKGYRTVDRKTKKMYVTRDVKRWRRSSDCVDFQDSGSTEMDLNPSVPPKVDTDSNESTGQSPQPSVKTSPEELRRPLRNRFPHRNIFNADFLLFQAQVREQSDPISYEEALNRPDAKEWLKAINEELASHHENQSGYSQRQGIDYEDTFAPTLGYSSLRYLLSLAAKYNLEVNQMDVVTAFLNLNLNEEIYMELPTGVGDENNKYCRLRKSIYGLKQASRAWYRKLDDTLRSFGLNRLQNEPCIYFLRKNKIFLAVGVYVDDLFILSNRESSKNELKMALCERFKMKDLGKAHWCLGIRIVQDVETGTLSIDQEQYIEEMLHRFRMSDWKGVKTPLDPNQILSKAMMPRSDGEIKQMHAVQRSRRLPGLFKSKLSARHLPRSGDCQSFF